MFSVAMSDRTWEAVAREAQSCRDASIRRVRPSVPDISLSNESFDNSSLPRRLLPQGENEITEAPPERIVKALAEERYTAVEVTTAFLRRAVIAQSAVLNIVCFKQAVLTLADELCYGASP